MFLLFKLDFYLNLIFLTNLDEISIAMNILSEFQTLLKFFNMILTRIQTFATTTLVLLLKLYMIWLISCNFLVLQFFSSYQWLKKAREIYKVVILKMGGNWIIFFSTNWCWLWREKQVRKMSLWSWITKMPIVKWGLRLALWRLERE